MPSITINGSVFAFEPGKKILQVALDNGIEIPHYCYHEAMSVVASCRICLAEVWAPNPRNDGKLEPIPKLLPTCQSEAVDGQVVYLDSPRTKSGQKSVMEHLLVNHPLDCPVCDKAGECSLQDYSYKYGRGESRFEETKVKQPKKDLGPDITIYSDRCIMCSRCVRFCREVSGTGELLVQGRGNQEQIDVFPGRPIDNELSLNVVDICPVGALQDKSFLYKKRVWDLTASPSIDGLTSGGDNIWIEHHNDVVYRLRPRWNVEVNKWWTSNEVRRSFEAVHAENRCTAPMRTRSGSLVEASWNVAMADAVEGLQKAAQSGKRIALLVSPMLSCEDAYLLGQLALELDKDAVLAVGPVPTEGEDKVYPPGVDQDDHRRYVTRAEKAPNARGVRRVLEALAAGKKVLDFTGFVRRIEQNDVAGAIVTGNYPSEWATDGLRKATARDGLFTVLLDTHTTALVDSCNVLLPSCTWAEKAGTFENVEARLQAFAAAIAPVAPGQSESQIAIDMLHECKGEERSTRYCAASTRKAMADRYEDLRSFEYKVYMPPAPAKKQPDMTVVEL